MIIDRTDFKINRLSLIQKVKKKKYEKKEPYYCPKCNKTWQVHSNITETKSHDKMVPQYLVGFPKFGCTKRVCILCKNKHHDTGTG
tara:strand:- start:383 stop:640 length:258 start_codon:yes stop_codon:yes gene_type:complete